MGSFLATCGISNLSIREGDKIGFVLLGAGEKHYDQGPGTLALGRSLLIYSTDDYRPFLPPVFGEYDDYGGIVNIQPSATTRLLEAKFHLPVEKVLALVGNRQRKVYDSSGPISDAYKASPVIYDNELSTQEKLLELGFASIQPPSPDGIEAYSFQGYILELYKESVWRLVKEKTSQVVAAALWSTSSSRNREVEDLLAKFSGVTHIYPGFAQETWESITILSQLSAMFFLENIFSGMKTKVMEETYGYRYKTLAETGEEFRDYFAWVNQVGDTNELYGYFPKYQRSRDFISQKTSFDVMNSGGFGYHMEFKEYMDNNEYMELVAVLDVMNSVNRVLAPTVQAGEGDNEASQWLNELTDMILSNRRINEQW